MSDTTVAAAAAVRSDFRCAARSCAGNSSPRRIDAPMAYAQSTASPYQAHGSRFAHNQKAGASHSQSFGWTSCSVRCSRQSNQVAPRTVMIVGPAVSHGNTATMAIAAMMEFHQVGDPLRDVRPISQNEAAETSDVHRVRIQILPME